MSTRPFTEEEIRKKIEEFQNRTPPPEPESHKERETRNGRPGREYNSASQVGSPILEKEREKVDADAANKVWGGQPKSPPRRPVPKDPKTIPQYEHANSAGRPIINDEALCVRIDKNQLYEAMRRSTLADVANQRLIESLSAEQLFQYEKELKIEPETPPWFTPLHSGHPSVSNTPRPSEEAPGPSTKPREPWVPLINTEPLDRPRTAPGRLRRAKSGLLKPLTVPLIPVITLPFKPDEKKEEGPLEPRKIQDSCSECRNRSRTCTIL